MSHGKACSRAHVGAHSVGQSVRSCLLGSGDAHGELVPDPSLGALPGPNSSPCFPPSFSVLYFPRLKHDFPGPPGGVLLSSCWPLFQGFTVATSKVTLCTLAGQGV